MMKKKRFLRLMILSATIMFLVIFSAGCSGQGEDSGDYKNVINLHTKALLEFQEGTFEMDDYVTGDYDQLQSEYMTYGFLENLASGISPAEYYFYGFTDLDGDSSDELIIMEKRSHDELVYHGIYSLDSGEPYMILDTGLWDRCRAFVYSDGTIEIYGSSGASDSTSTFYEFENGALNPIGKIDTNEGEREQFIPEKFGSMDPPDIEWIPFLQ